jgi:molybdenum cofactor guanylyltransferase
VTAAGIVLAGGRSSRMGEPKAALEWHGSTLLRRVTGIVARATGGPVVVVRAPGQRLPPLPATVELVEDPHEGWGPLQGLAAGLAAVAGRVDVAFVSATDAPFLHPDFVRGVVDALGPEDDVAVPVAGGRPHPLAAAYRTSVLAVAEELIAAERLRATGLVEACRAREVDPSTMPGGLDSLVNLNDLSDYQAARARPAPEVTVLREGRDPLVVRAATLGAAAVAAGAEPPDDPEEPLAEGDTVRFRFAPGGLG